ncbi:MAG: cupredoxin domain-containing protein [Actinomycetota bacterium]|nr:cupredoxin domain-containing protein [Actinomycetota bacterium]MDQ2980860.1 cupredoxin domain-containing protein [Actinomycetota bacterium]
MKRIVVAVAVVVVGVAVTGVVTAGAVTSSRVVSVKLNEFNILPDKQAAPAGKVTFVLKDLGKLTHEFVVVRTAKPAGSLLKGNKADETGAVGEVGELKPGQTKKLTLTLKKGHYALLCNLPGHYKAGQFVDFYVR